MPDQRSSPAAKHRGAFFTPSAVSHFLARWAIRSASDRVLEPSCGEASFLVGAARQLNELGQGSLFNDGQLVGIELHQPSIPHAEAAVLATGRSARIIHQDFFDATAALKYDVVLGNPPFIRYQTFSGSGREKAMRAALAAGVNLNGLASSWAPFLVHACQFLRSSGRIGFVLPAEMLTVKYAAPIREFLMRRFANVRLVVFEELVFPDALEDVVLLLAEGSGGCSHFEVHQVRNAEALSGSPLRNWKITPGAATKWSQALVQPDTWTIFQTVLQSAKIEKLGDWGRPFLGTVTGDNNYFTLTDADARKWKFHSSELVPISPPGSRHLRGLEFAHGAWNQAREEGKRCWLFCPSEDDLSPGAEAYIEAGEEHGVEAAYKCRVRDPWYVPPRVPVADLFLTYMDYERPRLTSNTAGVDHLNSLYGVTLAPQRRVLGREVLPLAALNSVTLLSAEIVGRAYGGGMLKLEPREAEQLAVPSIVAIKSMQEELRAIRPQAAAKLRGGKLSEAVEMVDNVIFQGRVEAKALPALRGAREFLFQRRSARGRISGEEEEAKEK